MNGLYGWIISTDYINGLYEWMELYGWTIRMDIMDGLYISSLEHLFDILRYIYILYLLLSMM